MKEMGATKVDSRQLPVSDFPILARKEDGRRIAYLDNAASTQKPRVVIEAITAFYERHNANIHRGLYALSAEATALYEEAREAVAKLVNHPPERLIFTAGTTDSLNMVAHGLAARLKPEDEILLTPQEHHANLVPWQQVAKRRGAKLVYCGLKEDFTIDVEDLKGRINGKTKVLAITHVSNVLGTITPLAEIIPYAKSRGVIVVVDGAQAVPHLKVDVAALGCDAYVFSAHKMYGPTGIGALCLSEELMGMEPYRTGGDMIDDVTEQEAEFAVGEPRRFEGGTPNIAGAAGFGAAATWLMGHDLDAEQERELALFRQAWEGLFAIPGIRLYGPPPTSPVPTIGIIEFTVDKVHSHDVAQILGDEGVCIRSGKHCAHPLLRRMGVDSLNRASFSLHSTEEDVASLIKAVKKAQEIFR